MKKKGNSQKQLQRQINQLPTTAGVYLFYNKNEEILYIGKAKNLKKRVQSYFRASTNLEQRKQPMLQKIVTLKTIQVKKEIEALILENTLIKKHQPPYNVLLKDDKGYQYIEIDHTQTYPDLTLVRRKENKKATYFGPYINGYALKIMLKTVQRLFPYKTCSTNLDKRPRKLCLDFHIGRCPGPCEKKITIPAYKKRIKQIEYFLKGDYKILQSLLLEEKTVAITQRNFEHAKHCTEAITAIEQLKQKQFVELPNNEDIDVLTTITANNAQTFNIQHIRGGKLTAQQQLEFKKTSTEEKLSLQKVVQQFYTTTEDIPKTILVNQEIEGKEMLAEWLSEKAEHVVVIKKPIRGTKKRLIEISELNHKKQQRPKHIPQPLNWKKASTTLKTALSLKKNPSTIECYDISNIQGTHAVGSCVVMKGGKAEPRQYKHFIIKTVASGQSDDFAMLQEVLYRRIQHATKDHKQHWPLPDIILIDGGTPQLRAVEKIIKQTGITVPVLGIAKIRKEKGLFEERIIYEGKQILKQKDNSVLKTLVLARNEAHRFAISHYRKTHHKKTVQSQLDTISGIGPKTKKKLLQVFGSTASIKQATQQELEQHISPTFAKKIKKEL